MTTGHDLAIALRGAYLALRRRSAAAEPKGKGFNFGAFQDVVLKDLIPLIDSSYRTLANREHRAIAGLSMGAAQALQIGLTHLDTFSAVGAFSGAGKVDPKTAYGGVFADAAAFDKKVSLLYLHSGTVGRIPATPEPKRADEAV